MDQVFKLFSGLDNVAKKTFIGHFGELLVGKMLNNITYKFVYNGIDDSDWDTQGTVSQNNGFISANGSGAYA